MNNLVLLALFSSVVAIPQHNITASENNIEFNEKEDVVIVRDATVEFYNNLLLQDLEKDYFLVNLKDGVLQDCLAIYYDHNNSEEFYLETTSTRYEVKKEELETFYNDVKEKIATEVSLSSTSEENIFEKVKSKTFYKIAKPYGRIFYSCDIYEYDFDKDASLYLAEFTQEFICGKMCIINGESGYEPYLNDLSYTHIQAYQEEADMGDGTIRYGCTPILKDTYPQSTPSTVTITSSYTSGNTIGYSTNFGFSTSEGMSVGGELTYDYSNSRTYEKTYTDTNPALSTQHGENPNEYQWTYIYNQKEEKTNLRNLGYIFECNNYRNGKNVKGHYKMSVEANVQFTHESNGDSEIVYYYKVF